MCVRIQSHKYECGPDENNEAACSIFTFLSCGSNVNIRSMPKLTMLQYHAKRHTDLAKWHPAIIRLRRLLIWRCRGFPVGPHYTLLSSSRDLLMCFGDVFQYCRLARAHCLQTGDSEHKSLGKYDRRWCNVKVLHWHSWWFHSLLVNEPADNSEQLLRVYILLSG